MRVKLLFILSLIVLSVSQPVFSDDWDDFAGVDRMWDGQKSITNKEFEEVMDALQANQKKKEEKQKKKLFKKIGGGGTSLHSDMNPEKEIKELQGVQSSDDGFIVNVPVSIIINSKPLEKGFYKLFAEKDDSGKFYVSFYQSQFFKAKLEVVETKDDFDEAELNFAKILPYNESFVKLIFGSLDFNAYAIIPFVN